ncbi:Protein of unknown function [Gryllus bimaculatus]|nr:Protein of unknown function [Gryllus bimaculatus]
MSIPEARFGALVVTVDEHILQYRTLLNHRLVNARKEIDSKTVTAKGYEVILTENVLKVNAQTAAAVVTARKPRIKTTNKNNDIKILVSVEASEYDSYTSRELLGELASMGPCPQRDTCIPAGLSLGSRQLTARCNVGYADEESFRRLSRSSRCCPPGAGAFGVALLSGGRAGVQVGAAPAGHTEAEGELFPLSVVHLNDFHARFEQTDPSGAACAPGSALYLEAASRHPWSLAHPRSLSSNQERDAEAKTALNLGFTEWGRHTRNHPRTPKQFNGLKEKTTTEPPVMLAALEVFRTNCGGNKGDRKPNVECYSLDRSEMTVCLSDVWTMNLDLFRCGTKELLGYEHQDILSPVNKSK